MCFPELIEEWDHEKNNLLPENYMPKSNKKVWWRCKNGHKWQTTINSRSSGTGCGYCKGLRVTEKNCLKNCASWILSEWDHVKNKDIFPDSISKCSDKRVWWKCVKGHSWLAIVDNRVRRKDLCPYCSGKVVCKDNNLVVKNPILAKEWNPKKNKKLGPEHVTPGSGKKVWWRCKEGHEWQAVIASRNSGVKCSKCSAKIAVQLVINSKLKKHGSLAKNKLLAKEWHSTKNNELKPEHVLSGSSKKVWWKCKNEHEWQAVINARVIGYGCPYCSGRKASVESNLSVDRPELAKFWHPVKNKFLKPHDVKSRSGKKVWWECKNGHEWHSTVIGMTRRINPCQYCVGKIASKKNNFTITHPLIAKEWDYAKNVDLLPASFTFGSIKNIWWKCENGHEWQTTINARTSHDSYCPFCMGNLPSKENNLSVRNPYLAKEWHPIKNGNLDSTKVMSGSGKKVWWKCKNGHEWQAVICSRNSGHGCPYCDTGKTSGVEIRVLCELKCVWKNVSWRKKIDGIEIDIFLEDYNIGVEVDGYYWHKDKYAKDIQKNTALKANGILLIRFRENRLQERVPNSLLYKPNNINPEDIYQLCLLIQGNLHNQITKDELFRLEKYGEKRIFHNNLEYKELLSLMPGPIQGESLQAKYPELMDEWHKDNHPINPNNIFPASNKKILWQCKCGNVWYAPPARRIKGHGCQKCGVFKSRDSRMKTILNARGTIQEHLLAKEWHSTKNGLLTPKDVTLGSGKKVWWRCKEGHEWQAVIGSRITGNTKCVPCKKQKKHRECQE